MGYFGRYIKVFYYYHYCYNTVRLINQNSLKSGLNYHILVPRGRAPFGQHQESRPLASYRVPTEVKRLSMREKLRGDRIVRIEKPCMSTASRLRLLVS